MAVSPRLAQLIDAEATGLGFELDWENIEEAKRAHAKAGH